MDRDHWIERLAAADLDVQGSERAPARLKARIYSALVNRLSETGPLLSLAATQTAGGRLCVFEQTVTALSAERFGSLNPCRVCHARVLAERLEHAPIFWPGCPYSEFHRLR